MNGVTEFGRAQLHRRRSAGDAHVRHRVVADAARPDGGNGEHSVLHGIPLGFHSLRDGPHLIGLKYKCAAGVILQSFFDVIYVGDSQIISAESSSAQLF